MRKPNIEKLPNEILLEVDGRSIRALTSRYVAAKTKQLQEFGYPTLTEKEVRAQLLLLLNGTKWTDVVGGFIESDSPRRVP